MTEKAAEKQPDEQLENQQASLENRLTVARHPYFTKGAFAAGQCLAFLNEFILAGLPLGIVGCVRGSGATIDALIGDKQEHIRDWLTKRYDLDDNSSFLKKTALYGTAMLAYQLTTYVAAVATGYSVSLAYYTLTGMPVEEIEKSLISNHIKAVPAVALFAFSSGYIFEKIKVALSPVISNVNNKLKYAYSGFFSLFKYGDEKQSDKPYDDFAD